MGASQVRLQVLRHEWLGLEHRLQHAGEWTTLLCLGWRFSSWRRGHLQLRQERVVLCTNDARITKPELGLLDIAVCLEGFSIFIFLVELQLPVRHGLELLVQGSSIGFMLCHRTIAGDVVGVVAHFITEIVEDASSLEWIGEATMLECLADRWSCLHLLGFACMGCRANLSLSSTASDGPRDLELRRLVHVIGDLYPWHNGSFASLDNGLLFLGRFLLGLLACGEQVAKLGNRSFYGNK